MKKLVIIASIILIGLNSSVTSQSLFSSETHEFSISVGGGLSTLLYLPDFGNHKNGFGMNFGLGYAYFFNPQWGIRTGIELGIYNSRFDASPITVWQSLSVPAGMGTPSQMYFQSVVTDFEEKTSAMMLQIPVMAQYNFLNMFYAAAGFKIGLPASGKFDSKGSFNNTAIVQYENAVYTDRNLGLGMWTGADGEMDGTFDYKASFMLALEAGAKFDVGATSTLYVGAYLDYGLNNISKASDVNGFVNYTFKGVTAERENFTVNSATLYSDKINPLSVGVRVRYAFGGLIQKGERAPVQSEPARIAQETPPPAPEQPAPVQPPPTQPPAQQPAPTPTQPVAATPQGMTAAQRDNLQRPVNGYDLNESVIDQRQAAEFLEKVQILRQHPEVRVQINGHTCDTGSDEINQRVGLARAERARENLLANGVSPNQIVMPLVSKLDREPVVANTSEANRKINRRVQLLIVE